MSSIKRLNSADAGFSETLKALLAWESVSDDAVFSIVMEILSAVRQRGDEALVEYSGSIVVNTCDGD